MPTIKKHSTTSSDNYFDEQKLVFDYIKHISTLDTGSIILLTVLLEKFFQDPVWKKLIPFTFGSFAISLVFLTLAALGVIRSIRDPKAVPIGIVRFTSWIFMFGLLGFLLGIIFMAVFATKNWS